MNILSFIKNLCIPSLIYLILGLLGAISSKNDMSGKIISVILVFLITYLLNHVCKTYGQTTSWYILIILYLLPFILLIIMFLIMFAISNKSSPNFAQSFKFTEKFSPPKITTKLSKIISSKI
jgi:hypothetical protein